MRSKEVEKAINMTEQLQQFIKELGKDFRFYDNENSVIAYESLGILLNYISELEEIVNSIDTQFIHKDKVFELVEELNVQIDGYNDAVDKFNKLLKGE